MLDKYKVLRTAERYFIEQKFVQAIREYKRLIETEGEDPALLNTLGDLYLREGQRQEAIVCFQKVAETYLNSGFVAKATAMYKKLYHLNPADATICSTLVDLFERQSLKREAVSLLLEQVDRHTDWGEPGKAWNALYRILELEPENAEFHFRAGRLQEQMDDLQQAMRHFHIASRIYQDGGDLGRAHSAATEAYRISPDDFEARKLLEGTGRALILKLKEAGEESEADRIRDSLLEAGLDPTAGGGLGRFDEGIGGQSAWEVPGTEPLEPRSLDFFDVIEPETPPADPAAAEEPFERIPGTETSGEDPHWEGSLEEALQEADFYLKLGLHEDARKLLTVLVREFPRDERVVRRAEKANVSIPVVEVTGDPAELQAVAEQRFELELESALNDLFTNEVGQIPDEVLRYDVVANGSHFEKGNPKIHYDLGLAYKEMGLLEDAIQKFEVAYEMLNGSGYNPQKILCCSMLANSFLQLGHFDKASEWARKGLDLPGKKDFEWKALQYDYCCALEKLGDNERALQGFQQLLNKDSEYRDVRERVGRL